MPTYVYETIPASPDDALERFHVRQSISEPALATHPERGVPIRRVITGGAGIFSSTGATERSASTTRVSTGGGGLDCGFGCDCYR
ncbi:MAG: zinc ribbon domain-containing protein [Betaproteobacteria bacterium]|nr:zinc ribbon domain-containing protein [Betaproteobacteria bacterium]